MEDGEVDNTKPAKGSYAQIRVDLDKLIPGKDIGELSQPPTQPLFRGVQKKRATSDKHPRYLFHLQNIRFRLQIQSLTQSFILKNTTLIFFNPSMTAGILQR